MQTLKSYEFPTRGGRQGKYTPFQNETIYRLTRSKDEVFNSDASAGKMVNRLKQVSYHRKMRLLWNIEDENTVVFQLVPRK